MSKHFQVLLLSSLIMGSGMVTKIEPNLALAIEQVNNEAVCESSIPPLDIKTEKDLNQWMTYYYLHPKPELTVKAIFFAEKKGMLDLESGRAPLIAFFSQIFAHNSAKLPTWIEQLKSLKQPHKNLIWSALWMANTPEAKSQMPIVAKQLMPNDQASIAKYTHKAVPLETMEISSPAILDMLWGSFLATGDERYVKHIMTVLPGATPTERHGEQLIISGAAQWSLTCNAHQHKRVLQICEKERTNQPALNKVLSEIIAKASTQQKNVTQNIHENKESADKQIPKHKLTNAEESSLANYSNSGLTALQQGNYAEARRLLLSAQYIAESSNSAHPQLLKMLGYLANAYNRLGDRESSEELYKQVIVSCEKSISVNSKECGLLHDGLGVTLLSAGRLADAKVQFQRANEIFRKFPGTDNEDLAVNLGNLASLYRKEGDNTKAESNWKQEIAVLEKTHDDAQLAIALHNLADLYRTQVKYTKAEPLFKKSISLTEKISQPNYPFLVADLEHYADLLNKTNRKSEADQIMARAKSIAAKQ